LGVTDGRLKYFVDIDGQYERLYDLKADPREQTDIAAQHRQIANEFRNRLRTFVQNEQRYSNRMSLRLTVINLTLTAQLPSISRIAVSFRAFSATRSWRGIDGMQKHG
jgi:hypothetical protein